MYMYITWSGFLKQTLVQKSSYLEPWGIDTYQSTHRQSSKKTFRISMCKQEREIGSACTGNHEGESQSFLHMWQIVWF